MKTPLSLFSNVTRHRLTETSDTISRVPFGKLIGGVLTSCVEAQASASDVAWNYTKEVLFQDDPSERHATNITFSYTEHNVEKSLTLPLLTVVPIPYLKLDHVGIDLHAKVSVDNENKNEFVATIGTVDSQGEEVHKSSATSNLDIRIDAHTGDTPTGIINLMKLIGDGGIIIEDLPDESTMPGPDGDPTYDPSVAMDYDPITGYPYDPVTHELIDPTTGMPLGGSLGADPDMVDPALDPALDPTLDPTTGAPMGVDMTGADPATMAVPPDINPYTGLPWDPLPDGERQLAEGMVDKQRKAQGSGYISFADVMRSIALGAASIQGQPSVDDLIVQARYPDFLPQGLRGVHVNWTMPFRFRNPNAEYKIEDHELLSTILSALLWRRFNGPIKLYTDNVGMDYYQRMQMLDLWNDGYDTMMLEELQPMMVDPEIFWAAGKLQALQAEPAPFVLMDTDLMVWRNIFDDVSGRQLVAFHRESLSDTGCYLPLSKLKKRPGYMADEGWNWKVAPCNTALVYYGDPSFASSYTAAAFDFMNDNHERPKEMVSQMVFAEQRIFSMVAKKNKVDIHTFLDYPEQQRGFTHLWGAKAEARDNPARGRLLCRQMCQVLQSFFPEWTHMAAVQQLFAKYL